MQLERQGHCSPITFQGYRSSRWCRGLRPSVAILGASLLAFCAGFIPAASAMPRVNVNGADTHLLLVVGTNLQSALEPAATTGAKAEITGPAVADGAQTAPTAQAEPTFEEDAAGADTAVEDGPQEGQAPLLRQWKLQIGKVRKSHSSPLRLRRISSTLSSLLATSRV